nr:WecB/TagA/CpsF family glycosyltransferase [Sphingomonas oleivorans]
MHICRQYYPGIGGLEAVVEALAREQLVAGHIVRVVTLDRIFGAPHISVEAQEILGGIEIVRIPFIGSERYPIAPAVLRHLKPADLVHVHGIDFFYDFLALTRPIHGKTLIATTHGGFFHTSFASRLKKIWFATITRASARSYAAIAACSLPDEAMFRKVAPRTTRLVENGVDTAKFRGVAAVGRPSMIYFGRLAPNKGLERMLRWFAAVRARAPEWTLIIAGKPMGVTAAGLRAQAAELGIETAVTILISPPDETLKRLIGRSSVYVCASHFEGFGLAAIEAAAAGLFPVLSRVPAFEATIDRIGMGMLIDFDDPAREAGRFLERWQARSDPEIRDMAERTVADFGWRRAARQYEKLYRDALHGRRQIGQVAIDVLSRHAALRRIRGYLACGAPLMVAFCNAHSVNSARTDPAFARAMGRALVLNDGIGVDLASRWLFGRPFPDNLNGTDLVPALLAAERRPLRLFLLGSAPGVAERAAAALRKHYHHQIVGVHHGHYDAAEEEVVLAKVIEAKPDLVLVGMGHPRQELWAAAYWERLPAVTMCIGAYLDFAAGVVPRAPSWVRRARMEWLYRLWQEPRRLAKRYLVGNLSFLFFVALQRLRGAPPLVGSRAAGPAPATTIAVRPRIGMRA